MVTFAGVALGLATSTNVVKYDPVAPSARNHDVDPAGTPADSWPPSNSRAVPKYIDRSATIGAVASTAIANDWLASSAIPLVASVTREVGGTLTVRVTGGAPSRRNLTVAVEAAAPMLASRTNVWKVPSEPSANSQRSRGPSTAVPVCAP